MASLLHLPWSPSAQKQQWDQLQNMDVESTLDWMEQSGLPLTRKMCEVFLLRCREERLLSSCKRVHQMMVRSGYGHDRFLLNSLVDIYCRCDSFEDARAVFEQLPSAPSVAFPWNVMIAAFAQRGHLQQLDEALVLYRRMMLEGVHQNAITFVSALGACSAPRHLQQGRFIHACVLERGLTIDEVMATALVTMYGRCGAPREASKVFEAMYCRDPAAWNAMVGAFARNGQISEAIRVTCRMALEGIRLQESSFVVLLDACAAEGAFDEGLIVHAMVVAAGLERRATVATALATMYGRCGSMAAAARAFEAILDKDLVAWNAMLAAFAQNGHYREALGIYYRMNLEGVAMDTVTAIGAATACAGLAAVATGRSLHQRVLASDVELSLPLGTAFINMYGRCGLVEEAETVFGSLEGDKNVATWTAMMASYVLAGHLDRAIAAYRSMLVEGLQPSYITLVSVLFACNHAGLLDEAVETFFSMGSDFGVELCEEHWSCIVDLLGRAGRLEDAEGMISAAPLPMGLEAWMGLLGACRTHGDLQRGARIARRAAARADDETALAPMVLLRNMCAAAGEWEEASRVRREMAAMQEEQRLRGTNGRSFVEAVNRVHEFVAGVEHPEWSRILDELRRLEMVPAEEGRNKQCEYHTELVAAGYGLLVLPPGRPVRVVSSHAVCAQCHEAFKRPCREIVLRDCFGLHRFEAGLCSCGK